MAQATDIIKRPLVTEKSTWEGERHNRFSFEVAMDARKDDIKRAIESLYGVRVTKVHTQVRKGNYFRTRFGPGKKPSWKRAVVELNEDDRIELF